MCWYNLKLYFKKLTLCSKMIGLEDILIWSLQNLSYEK